MRYPKPPEFVAQGDRVLVIGVATGKIYATNKPYKDEWVFDITVRDGKVAHIKEYIDTQALARASETVASPRLPFWTNRQKNRAPEQFPSTAKELYSTVLNATHLPRE